MKTRIYELITIQHMIDKHELSYQLRRQVHQLQFFVETLV